MNRNFNYTTTPPICQAKSCTKFAAVGLPKFVQNYHLYFWGNGGILVLSDEGRKSNCGLPKNFQKKLKKMVDTSPQVCYNKYIKRERKRIKEMDKRITYKVVLDTETCPLDRTFEGVSPLNMFCYDIGWAIVDKRGKVYRTRSFIIDDIFNGEKELMQSAYYAWKVPQYLDDIQNGSRLVVSFYEARKTLCEDMKEFGIKEVYAHNMRFDYGTLNNTQKWLTKSKYRYFFPYGTEICDTMKMAQDVICQMPTFKKFCIENGFVCKNGQVRKTAEVLYRFITKDVDFQEEHKALQDVLIEKEILAYCYKQKKKMRRLLWEKA